MNIKLVEDQYNMAEGGGSIEFINLSLRTGRVGLFPWFICCLNKLRQISFISFIIVL